ncbi:MAG: hypothetical protein ACRDQ5_14625 [Sciscionella sp.]
MSARGGRIALEPDGWRSPTRYVVESGCVVSAHVTNLDQVTLRGE